MCFRTNSYALHLCCSGKKLKKQISSVMENGFLFLKRPVELSKEIFLDKIIGQDFNAKPIYSCLKELLRQDFRKRWNQEDISLEFTMNYSTIFFFDSTNRFRSLSNHEKGFSNVHHLKGLVFSLPSSIFINPQ